MLFALLALVGAFVFGKETQAFNACLCSCVEDELVQTQLQPAPATGQSCTDVCSALPNWETSGQDAYIQIVSSGGSAVERCACTFTEQTQNYVYQKVASTATSCSATCASACGGAQYVDSEQDQTSNVQNISCINASDCTTADFSRFQGVSCTYVPSEDASYPIGVPTCTIPPTQENADLECQNFGGEAKGANARCMPVSALDNLQGMNITRPYLQGSDRSYAYTSYTGDYSSIDQLRTVLDANGIALENSTTQYPGLCYLFGRVVGVDYTDIDLTSLGVNLFDQAAGTDIDNADYPDTSRRYVCVSPKHSLCGSIAPESDMEIQTRSAYSCVSQNALTSSQASQYCFASSWTGTRVTSLNGEDVVQNLTSADLCTTQGTLCCASSYRCTSDYDCGSYKSCNVTTGECEWNPVCDNQNPNRRCRNASSVEQNTASICTSESILQMSSALCPNPSQFCCEEPNQAALSSCAADMEGIVSNIESYACVDVDELPSDQWVLLPSGEQQIRSWQNGGACITNDVPAEGVPGASPVSRCRVGSACCNAVTIGYSQLTDSLAARPAIGASCGDDMRCTSLQGLISEREVIERGFSGLSSFYQALGNSSYCDITPLSTGNYGNTQECQPGGICCLDSVSEVGSVAGCQDNSQCSAGSVCDPQLKFCIPSQYLISRLASTNCVDVAEAQGETNADVIIGQANARRQDFTCQIVDNQSSAVQAGCIRGGCALSQALPAGSSYWCCGPGIGQTPTQAAETQRAAQITAPESPFSIKLSPCISSGDCSLDDIVYTGAQFANFLIAISGSVFLAIFVYAGFLYLTAGTSDRAGKAKKMLVSSTIGIVLMFSGYILIRFLTDTFINSASPQSTNTTVQNSCGSTPETADYSCTFLVSDPSDEEALSQEISDRGCVRDLCGDQNNRQCCP